MCTELRRAMDGYAIIDLEAIGEYAWPLDSLIQSFSWRWTSLVTTLSNLMAVERLKTLFACRHWRYHI